MVQAERVRAGADGGLFGCDCDGLRGVGRDGDRHGCPNASLPPHIAVSGFVRRVKGCSSHRVRMEFPDLRMRYWGRHFWARGYFSTTSGNITDDVRLQYRQEHEPPGVSR